ncbi:MAG: hypothetical protein QW244_02535 [Candidatus Pacearchaeota archaeon]
MPVKYASEEVFKKLLEKLGVKYRGVSKSGEPQLQYGNRLFSISRKEKFKGGNEGYKVEAIRKMLGIVSLEKSKEERKSPGAVYNELMKISKEILGSDF